jgi:hypothetical protein
MHLEHVPRGMSIFWRQLRPELLRAYTKPLSPDANVYTTYQTPDWKEQYEDVAEATEHLINSVIPKLAKEMSQATYARPLSQGLGIDVTGTFTLSRAFCCPLLTSLEGELHGRGINIRHLGLLRNIFWRQLPGKCNLSFNQPYLYTSTDLRDEASRGAQVLHSRGCNTLMLVSRSE